MNTDTQINPSELHATIKLGIDAHAKWIYVGRQLDGATPQPVQKMTFDGLLRFVAKRQKPCTQVLSCYEAGAFIPSGALDSSGSKTGALLSQLHPLIRGAIDFSPLRFQNGVSPTSSSISAARRSASA